VAEIGLAEAARLAGKNASTIHRAMKVGRLSYTVGAAGERRIDPAELERVFGTGNGATAAHAPKSHDAHVGELAALQRLLDDRDATIRDLRARLDLEADERRRLTLLLTGPRRPWWHRWLR
jgi:hypothetical protein